MATQATGLLSATSAPSLYNLLGQQTNNQYWGDLMAIENAKRVANIGEGRGLRDLIKQAAQRLGYTGQLYGPSGAQDLAGIAAQMGMTPEQLASMQSGAQGAWLKDGDIGKRDQTITDNLRADYTDKLMLDWLTSQGYTVDTVDTGREHVQQLRGPNGEIIAVDASNYINDNKAVDRMGMAGALIIGGLAATPYLTGGEAAAGAGTVGSEGVATLSPGLTGTTPTLTTASLPSGMTAGMTGGSAIGYAPTSAQLWGAGSAAGAGLGGAGGGGTSTLSSALTGSTPSVTTQGLTASEIGFGSMGSNGAFSAGLTGGEALSTIPTLSSGAGSSLWDAAKGAGSKVVDAFTSSPNAGQNWASLLGAAAGAAEGGKSNTATTSQQIDPRMAQYLYGTGYGDTNSLLGAAQNWFKNNQSGMNANMQQGLDTLKSLYTSPGYTQGYTQMRDVGQGLLGRPIAGNPFTQGGLLGAPQMPAQGQQPAIQPPRPDIGVPPPTMQAPSLGLLQGTQQMPGPDIGLQKFNRPAWSI